MRKKQQTSETLMLGVILAAVGGFLDAYTYLCRGHVFANAQTGNIVLFGMRLAQGNISEAMRYLISIVAFAAGIVVAELVRALFWQLRRLHWRQIVVAFEIAVLVLAAFLPASPWSNSLVNIMVSFVCALQVQTFRKLNGSFFATTMCTGNLRSATEFLYQAARKHDRALARRGLSYLCVILFFVLGAMLGAAATSLLGIHAMLIAALILAAVFCIMFIENL